MRMSIYKYEFISLFIETELNNIYVVPTWLNALVKRKLKMSKLRHPIGILIVHIFCKKVS
jgi:hypothetical protein